MLNVNYALRSARWASFIFLSMCQPVLILRCMALQPASNCSYAGDFSSFWQYVFLIFPPFSILLNLTCTSLLYCAGLNLRCSSRSLNLLCPLTTIISFYSSCLSVLLTFFNTQRRASSVCIEPHDH